MAAGRKYAGLVDLDAAAPDIYETPELTDDTSTVPTSSTLRSESRASSTDGLEGNDPAIDRHRVDPTQARNSFLTDEAQDTTSHGWISNKRAAYRSSARRAPRGGNKDSGSVDDTDEEDEETLERKLARLHREVAEVKDSYQRRIEAQARHPVPKIKVDDSASTGKVAPDPLKDLDSLTQILDGIDRPRDVGQDSTSQRLIRRLDDRNELEESQTADETKQNIQTHPTNGYSVDLTSSSHQVQTLSKISDFDKRLRLLEAALGMDIAPLPMKDRNASRAVFPILDGLDRQISTISISGPSLDRISRQIRQMTDEAEKLSEARKVAAAQLNSSQSSIDRKRMSAAKSGAPAAVEAKEDPTQTSKVNALYGALPTIENLSPLLPIVLDRLRSLRTIHADAATASESLTNVESRQAAMAEDIKEWREGLKKVEEAMQHGEVSTRENMRVVDGWVKELESRVQKTNALTTG
ncbi:MAG: hypothetical protein Q9168_003787 [Polycauliona sp. 1 TL-2023]